MNHFKPIPPGCATLGEVRFRGSNGGDKKTRFIYSVPNGYTPKKSFPVVVALHGGGDNAAAFHDLWKSVTDSMGFVLLTPQGENPGPENFGWTWGRDDERAVLICLDVLRKEVHVDEERIYAAGFSAGGRLAYGLGFGHPDLFRGIAALSASFDSSLVRDVNPSARAARIFISHGSLETGLEEETALAEKTLTEAGFIVKSVRYEGIGHGLPDPMTAELRKIIDFMDEGREGG
jgi:phospholipase/carboxylesterase